MTIEFVPLPYVLDGALSYLMMTGAGYLAWRFVRAYERRAVEPERVRALAARVHLLEMAVEQVEDSIQETADAQQFTTTLLMSRAALGDGAPGRPPSAGVPVRSCDA
jgi:hypothetical protein